MACLIRGVLMLLSLTLPSALMAQGTSPVHDLLSASQAALNDLRFEESTTLAEAVLDLPTIRRAERIQALQLLAAASYPEVEQFRNADSAMTVLRSLVRIAPTAAPPREVTWPGLDTLWHEARASTFGLSAIVPDGEVSLGFDEAALVEVAVSLPSFVSIVAVPAGGGAPIPLDSAEVTEQGTLRITLLRDLQPVLPSGSYELLVRGSEPILGDSISLRYAATVDAPPVDLLPPLAPFDSTRLMRERVEPRRVRGIIGGALVAVGSVLVSSVAYGGTLSPENPRDSRAILVGLLMGIGAGAGVWQLDQGSPIPENIAVNIEARDAYADERAAHAEENERLIAEHRARLVIDTEHLP